MGNFAMKMPTVFWGDVTGTVKISRS